MQNYGYLLSVGADLGIFYFRLTPDIRISNPPS